MIDLSALIDAYLERKVRPREIGSYWPSEIPYCIRQLYFRYTYPKPWPREKVRLFRSADKAHRFIAAVLSHADGIELVESEKEFSLIYDEFSINGRIDDLIWTKSKQFVESPLVPIEVKTISGKWADMEKLEVKREHAMQLMPYLKATRTPVGIVWYLSRDDFRDRWFEVRYSEELMDQVVHRARDLHKHLTKEIIPPAEAKSAEGRGWECKFCLWSDECAEEGW